jgi:hypothetical protein
MEGSYGGLSDWRSVRRCLTVSTSEAPSVKGYPFLAGHG